MLQFSNLSLSRGHKLLFEQASFQIHPGQKVGVTGANGSGKSSLFLLILDELHSDVGDCVYPKDWVISHVAQESPAEECAAIEYVLDGDCELRQVEAALAKAEEQEDGEQIAVLHTQFDNIQGYTARSRAGQLLYGLGFKSGEEHNPVKTFSGGWRMRLNLARALMCRADLLLLDEPTNHLDLDAVIWLENWLRTYPGTLLLISHDRDFLDSVCSHIAHLEKTKVTLYSGNYSAFERIRAERLANQRAEYVKQQREIAHIHSYIERFRAKATKARQAQSRLKALQRMEQIAPAHVDSPFHFFLRKPEKLPNVLMRLEAVSTGYEDTIVLSDINLTLMPGDRIGLLGSNGAGKSTLIKLLANELRSQAGEFEVGRETRIGYFAQHQLEQLHPQHTPVEHLQQIDPAAREQELRAYLGGFGFSHDQALMPTAPFSGGEKSRLALALLIYQRPNLILLDEPTNHLDIEMRQALAIALQDYSGAMVMVSHDRHLLRVSCDRLLLVHDHCVDDFPQSLDEYPKWLSEQHKQNKASQEKSASTNTATARKEIKRQQAEQRKLLQPLRKKVDELETRLNKLHTKKIELEKQLAVHDMYSETNKERLKQCLREKATVDDQCEQTEIEWLNASDKLEAMNSD